MMVRGRTVAVLIIVAMVTSSFLTLSFVESKDLVRLFDTTSLFNEKETVLSQESEKIPEEMERFNEAYQKIQSAYIEKKDEKELINGAILGMIQSLNDPHSTYMDAKETKEFFSSLSDSFEGIGAEVTLENGKITVIAPIKGSPSEKAGLQPKDQIIKVNDESLEGLNLFEAVRKIRGPKGTKAKLEIVRPGKSVPITLTVIRDQIPIETIYSEVLDTRKGIIGKIEITNFGEKTAEDFKKALAGLENKKINGLIIDLRGNPGGYLQSVLDIGNLVIPSNGIIVQIEDRNKKRQAYKSNMGEAKYPIITLIDGGSASASEILASALQEAGKYPVIGEPSYGKGTVQNPFELNDGSNMKLTIAKWLTPNGNWIHSKGVQPDIKVSQHEYFNAMPFPDNVQIKLDTNNNLVQNLQLILNGLGYKTKRHDGYFDKDTESAVKAFQKLNGLEVNGVVEAETANKLKEKILERIKDPDADLQLQVAIETLLKLIK